VDYDREERERESLYLAAQIAVAFRVSSAGQRGKYADLILMEWSEE
jgi:hypothetical protein